MNIKQQGDAFADSLDQLIDRYAMEFDLPCSIVVGILFTKAHLIIEQVRDKQKGEEENG